MVISDDREQAALQDEARLALLLLQVAAAQAGIGCFAARQRATPQTATRLYRAAMTLGGRRLASV